jgi:hypothetical protein
LDCGQRYDIPRRVLRYDAVGTTFDPGPLANSTTYYWRIDEVNAQGTTTGVLWSFTTVDPLPGQAFSPSPADSATDVVITPTLSWATGSDATSHDVYFGTNPAPDSGEFQGNQAGVTFNPPTLTNSTTYYWRIDEVNAQGTTTGVVWSFTTAAVVGLQAETGVVSAVGNSTWTTVNLTGSYTSMVVVGTPNYDGTSVPLVVRIQNASGSSFDVRVDRTDGQAGSVGGVDVHYLVVEEGVYTQGTDGVTMEAVKFTSTLTDGKGNWIGESRSYTNSYSSPVVIGQVMSYNDSNFSTFWSRGSSKANPPSSTQLFVGKHVGSDPNTTRANETVGYIVIEAGTATLNGQQVLAGLGSDTVLGVSDSPPYAYSISGLPSTTGAVVSQSAMDVNDGGWAILYGSSPVSTSTINLAIDEDQAGDSERRHRHEQVAYIVFE